MFSGPAKTKLPATEIDSRITNASQTKTSERTPVMTSPLGITLGHHLGASPGEIERRIEEDPDDIDQVPVDAEDRHQQRALRHLQSAQHQRSGQAGEQQNPDRQMHRMQSGADQVEIHELMLDLR